MILGPIETAGPEETESDPTPSLRESLDASFDELSEEPAAAAAEPDGEPPPEETPEEKAAAQRARDEQGKFTKTPKAKTAAAAVAKPAVKPVVKPGAAPVGKVPTSAQQPGAQQQAVVPQMKPPQAWRDGAKKVWASLPEEARVEVLRRENEVGKALAGAAEDRKYAQTLRQTMAPYEAQIRAEGSTPEKAIGNLLNTAQALRSAPPMHKAQLVAGMIRDFQIPLEGLVHFLSGAEGTPPGGQQQHQQQQPIDAATIVKQVEERLMKQLGSQRDAALVQKSAAELETFLGDKAMHGLDGTDYTDEIRDSMADFIESASNRGKSISLEQAYKLAASMHPEVSQVLERQTKAAAATKQNQSSQRARAAAVTVRREPATTPVQRGQGLSLRDTLSANFDSLSE